MSGRQGLLAFVVIAAAVIAVSVLSSRGGSPSSSQLTPIAATPTPIAAAPSASTHAELLANEQQANQLITGPLRNKLAALRGVPVVINQWASWCENCRAEFPFFAVASKRYADRVAFVGLDSQDVGRDAAAGFLAQFPVNYPSILDTDSSQARSIGAGRGWPTTLFLDSRHRLIQLRVGGYTTLASLDADIRSYTL